MKHRILVVAGGLLLVGSLVSAQTSLEAEISLGDVSAELDRLAAMEDDTVVGDALRRYVKELRTVVGDASGSQSAADHGDNEVAAIVRDLERILTSRRASDIAAGVRQYVVSLGVLVAVRTSSESGGGLADSSRGMSDSSSQSREVSPSADRANGDTDVGASSVVVEWESDLPEGMVQADTGGLHPIEFSDERLRALPDTWLNHVGLRYHLLFIESFLFSTPDGKLDSARSGTRIGVRFINTADRDIRGFRGTLTITDISHFTDVVIRVGYSVIGSIPAGAAVYWASRVPVDAWPDPSKLHVFLPHDVSLSISVDEVVYE